MTQNSGCWAVLAMGMVLACGAMGARAQSTLAESVLWPGKEQVLAGTTLKIVTEDRPKTQQTCHVLAFFPDRIECKRHFGREPKVYRSSQVQKLIRRGNHPHSWLVALGVLATGSGVMTGAMYLASITIVMAVPVALVGGVVIYLSAVIGAVGDEEVPDQLLYVR